MARHELAVIGAGPAGLAAALAAADEGVRVVLIDGAADAGGQFYRQTARQLHARRPERLHHGWRTWERLRARLAEHRESGRITFLAERHVWHVEPSADGFAIHALVGPDQKSSETDTADGLVLATGGYERVLPFPGWTFPGVLTAGGAQAMLKSGLVLPGRRVVVAGAGPLLMPVAAGLVAAGADVAGLYDSSDPRAFVRHLRALSRNAGKLMEGAGYTARLARHGVRLRFRHSVVAAHGSDRVEAVTVAGPDGRTHRIACDALAVSHGLLPHTEIAQTLGARLSDTGFVAVDVEQRTDVRNLWAAGETTGIGGAALSLVEGEIAGRSAAATLRRSAGGAASSPVESDIAGRSAAARLGRSGDVDGGEASSLIKDEIARRAAARICRGGNGGGAAYCDDATSPMVIPGAVGRARRRLRAFAEVVESAYSAPDDWASRVDDETVLCRCEEVPAAAVREAASELGATDLRTIKLLTRAGMGWCQGRVCAPVVAGVAGCALAPAASPFARPVPLGVLAEIPIDGGAAS